VKSDRASPLERLAWSRSDGPTYHLSSVRGWILAAVIALAATGCGATAGDAIDEGSTTGKAAASAPAVERCTERLLRDADSTALTEEEREAVRRYAETTYCSRFAERGWVYDDGTLSIEAHKWLEQAGEEECAQAEAAPEGGPAKPGRTVPCDEFNPGGAKMIAGCALLHHVRRSEVREYLDQLRRRHGNVECEDSTPLAELGAP
jgi:hypothetical protein